MYAFIGKKEQAKKEKAREEAEQLTQSTEKIVFLSFVVRVCFLTR
jgi:hypothetical protein